MSEKKFEECTLEEATHIEMNGVVYNVAGNICIYYHGLRWVEEDVWIPIELFQILGIKPLREKKREPIEFEFTFGGNFRHPIVACGKTFRCVEILEEKK